jgi:hypothetical protein
MENHYRIIESSYLNGLKKGFVVQVKIAKWSLFGIKYKWIPYLTVSGQKQPWYYSTYERAMSEMILQIRRDIISK